MSENPAPEPQPEALIAFCPCCCTNIDLVAVDGDSVDLSCVSCETSFTLKVSLAAFAEHSMYG